MGLDIRIPIGLMFLIFGILLAGYGLVSGAEIYRKSLGLNVNLWWGGFLVLAGAILTAYGARGSGAMRGTEKSAEGRAIEERERRTGIEPPAH